MAGRKEGLSLERRTENAAKCKRRQARSDGRRNVTRSCSFSPMVSNEHLQTATNGKTYCSTLVTDHPLLWIPSSTLMTSLVEACELMFKSFSPMAHVLHGDLFCCLSPRDFHTLSKQAGSWFSVQIFPWLKYRALWAWRWARACCFRWLAAGRLLSEWAGCGLGVWLWLSARAAHFWWG